MKREDNYIEKLKSGDEKVFRQIMDDRYNELYNFAFGYLNNKINAEEVGYTYGVIGKWHLNANPVHHP